jgi:integrase
MDEFNYIIYAPAGKHKKFRLIKVHKVSGKSEVIRSKEIDRLNEDYLAENISEAEIRKELESVRSKIYKQAGIPEAPLTFNSENRKLLERYWRDEYEFRASRLVDIKTARWELERAVDAVGSVSLKTGTRNALQKEVDIYATGRKQRRIVAKLNQILKYLKRDFTLLGAKKDIVDVRHLSPEDVALLIFHIDDEWIKLLHEVGFRTGCRVGEAFAMESKFYDPKRNTIKIKYQIDKGGRKRGTKNSKERTAFVLPGSADILNAWFKIKDKFPQSARLSIAKYTKKAAFKAFPKQPSKWIVFHDLRHCYAINLLSKGVPLSQVAQSLGDSVSVAEEYYTGYDLSPSSIDLINKILKGA